MPAPDRPVTGATIDSVWGQWIHDYTLAPAGCVLSGGNVTSSSVSGTYVTLPIDTAVEDPGGYVDVVNNRVLFPADSAGLYSVHAHVRSDEGDASDESRAILTLNGDEIARDTRAQEGSTAVALFLANPAFVAAAGDQLRVRATRIGSGDEPTLGIVRLTLVRIGLELGAPTS